jgi:predicted nucleotidyltransferase
MDNRIKPHQRRWIEKNLVENDINFVIIGGFAVNYYCKEREFLDIDIFVMPDKDAVRRMVDAITSLRNQPNMVAKLLDRRVGHCKIGHPQNIDIICFPPGIIFEETYNSAEIHELSGLKIPIISRDLLIQHKETVGEEKDLKDVNMLKNS